MSQKVNVRNWDHLSCYWWSTESWNQNYYTTRIQHWKNPPLLVWEIMRVIYSQIRVFLPSFWGLTPEFKVPPTVKFCSFRWTPPPQTILKAPLIWSRFYITWISSKLGGLDSAINGMSIREMGSFLVIGKIYKWIFSEHCDMRQIMVMRRRWFGLILLYNLIS